MLSRVRPRLVVDWRKGSTSGVSAAVRPQPRSAVFRYRDRMSTVIEFRGSFRCVVDGMDRLSSRSRGTWYCRCGALAETTHEKPRCEICAARGNCGLDCTLSSLRCPSCGATEPGS